MLSKRPHCFKGCFCYHCQLQHVLLVWLFLGDSGNGVFVHADVYTAQVKSTEFMGYCAEGVWLT